MLRSVHPKKDADDSNLFAKSVLDQIIAKHDPEAIWEQAKNPHAVALGLREGSKGDMPEPRARPLTAAKVSKKRRVSSLEQTEK